MESIEVQLISSLIKSLISSPSDYEKVFKSLARLPQTQIITNYLLNFFSKIEEAEMKTEVILLYFKYFEEKRMKISELSEPILFDHFKHLICEIPPFKSVENYLKLSSILTFYIQNLKTFSDSSVYQSIIDWTNNNTPIALFSLSEVHENYFGRCLSNIILNFKQEISQFISLSLLLLNHKFESIDSTAANFFKEKKVPNLIEESIKFCFDNDDEYKRIGFLLLESILHFLPDSKSIEFYKNLSDTIFSVFEKCNDSLHIDALRAFCELPSIEDESISITKQLSMVISSFGAKITDFDSELSDQIIKFTETRMKNSEKDLSEIIESLFSVDELINGASLLSCRFNLIGEFKKYVFPEFVTEQSRALSSFYSIEYLNAHDKLVDDLLRFSLRTFLSAVALPKNEKLENEFIRVFEIIIHKMKFNELISIFFDNILYLLNSSIVDKIIDIFMKHCKENKSCFSNVKKATNEDFIERIFPYLMKFSICSAGSQYYVSYLVILIFISAMKTGEFKAICELIDTPLSHIFEKLIPLDCQPEIKSKALEIYTSCENEIKDSSENETKLDNIYNFNMSSVELQSSASLIVISIKSSNENSEDQINVAKDFVNKDSFNNVLFERFFASIAYIKSDESIDFLTSIVLNKEEENADSKSLTSLFFKKTPFLKSIFFQSNEFSSKFSKESIINTLNYISSLEMSSSSISKLFSIFFVTYELNTKSRLVLLSLSKQHKKCQLSDKIIQFVISSDYFVEVIPDFLYEIEQITEGILQKAFKTYFEYGNQSSFDAFCKSAFENFSEKHKCFSILASSLLQSRDAYKMMSFANFLTKYNCNDSEIVPKLTIQFAMNILSNDNKMRNLCQKCLFALYLLKMHINDSNYNEEEFINQNFESSIEITSLPFNESVLKILEFFEEIVKTELFTKNISETIEIIRGISPIELPIALLSLSICKQHLETQEFVLYLTKEGNINNSNNALVKYLINQVLTEIINHDFNKFMQYISNDMSNPFTKEFISTQFKTNEKNHDLLIKYILSQFLTLPNEFLSESDINSGKYQLFLVLCMSNSYNNNNNSSFDEQCKKDDFLLIWLCCFALVNLNRSNRQISLIVRRDYRSGINSSLKCIFERFHYECPAVEEREFTFIESFSKKIAQFIFSLSLSEIMAFISSLNMINLKKGALSDITIVVIFILSNLLKFFIQAEKNDPKNNVYISNLTNLIQQLCSVLKDDACRIISAKFASLFTVNNLQLFSEEGKKSLLLISIRSLIILEESTKNSCLIFLSMILAVSSSESIIKYKEKLLETIARCFDLKKVVGVEILLDSIQSIISVDSNLDPFNNMGLISIPWFLILSLNDNDLIRFKSINILMILSSNKTINSSSEDLNNYYSDIVNGFVEKLGAGVMIVFGNFLIDWCLKNGFNVFSMKLTFQIASAIKKNGQKLAEKFLNKTSQALIPIVNDSENSLQGDAIEILSVLME